MKKNKAIKKAKDFYEKTNNHAHVVEVDGTYQWYCQSYFDNGTNEEMTVIYSTWD